MQDEDEGRLCSEGNEKLMANIKTQNKNKILRNKEINLDRVMKERGLESPFRTLFRKNNQLAVRYCIYYMTMYKRNHSSDTKYIL